MELPSNETPALASVLRYGVEEMHRFGHKVLTPNHMFLGLLKVKSPLVIYLLVGEFGMNLEELTLRTEIYLQQADGLDGDGQQGKFSDAAIVPLLRSSVKMAFEERREPSAMHVLLAILQNDDLFITQELNKLGLNYDNAFSHVQEFYRTHPSYREGAPPKFIDLTSKGLSDGKKLFRNLFGDNPDDIRLNKSDNDEAEGRTFRNLFGDTSDEPSQSLGNATKHDSSAQPNSPTPTLDAYSTDLTLAARKGQLDPMVGRQAELERIVQILSRRKKNNPILIGEPGVGKSAIVEGLAQLIAQNKVARTLLNKRIVALDIAAVVAGTKYRGQFEERIKAVLTELSQHPDIILFIDEIHTIVGSGNSAGSLDTANIIKPALARGEIRCIGSTTLDEYRQHIEKDGALERRFQRVLVEPTTPTETLEILHRISPRYQDHHHVRYTEAALRACVSLTDRYQSGRCLPDKAIDALDEAGARMRTANAQTPESIARLEQQIVDNRREIIAAVKRQQFEHAASLRDFGRQLSAQLEAEQQQCESSDNYTVVDEPDVAAVVAMMTGVPVQRIAQSESQRLLNMGQALQGAIVGQDNAIAQVVRAIQRNRAGLKSPNKPIGTFIFLGPTGVGKTQLAKAITRYLFESADNLIRIDMSEYMEKFAVSRLVGAPPGYVGYEEGGQLTERVRRKPYSVVLLDEVEKAHPDVFHLLLQVMDEGRLTDSLGRVVDFKNTIIIMTSNIGSRTLMEFGQGIGFATKAKTDALDSYANSVIQKALKQTFSPEFLNRIDDIIMFNSLSRDDIHQIIDIELKDLYNRMENAGYQLKISAAAKSFIADKGYDPQFGARPLKRAIQKYLEDSIAERLLMQGGLLQGGQIAVGYNKAKDSLTFKIVPTESLMETNNISVE